VAVVALEHHTFDHFALFFELRPSRMTWRNIDFHQTV
jgi:hypothetical protein